MTTPAQIADALDRNVQIVAAQVALVAVTLRYLRRRPGRIVLTANDLDEALRLLRAGAIGFADVDDSTIAIVFDGFRRPELVE